MEVVNAKIVDAWLLYRNRQGFDYYIITCENALPLPLKKETSAEILRVAEGVRISCTLFKHPVPGDEVTFQMRVEAEPEQSPIVADDIVLIKRDRRG